MTRGLFAELILRGSKTTGGVHLPNVPQLFHASRSPTHMRALDGIAVISDIVSSATPEQSARDLSQAVKKGKEEVNNGKFAVFSVGDKERSKEDWLEGVVGLMKVVKDNTPLAHQVSPLVGISTHRVGTDASTINRDEIPDDEHGRSQRFGQRDPGPRR